MFQTVPLSIIRSFFFLLYTQQWYVSYRFAVSLRDCSSILILLYLQWKTPDDGQRNCPKHVELHSKNKFEKLVHLSSWFYCKKWISIIFKKYVFTFSGGFHYFFLIVVLIIMLVVLIFVCLYFCSWSMPFWNQFSRKEICQETNVKKLPHERMLK
jgi:uncharacterized membrane protein